MEKRLTAGEAYGLYNEVEKGLIPPAQVSSAYVQIIEGLLDEETSLIFEICKKLDNAELQKSMYVRIAEESFKKGDFQKAQRAYAALDDQKGIRNVAEAALLNKNFYTAQEAYAALNDRKGIKRTGEAALLNEQFYEAHHCFNLLQDRKGLFRTWANWGRQNKQKDDIGYFITTSYFGQEFRQKIWEKYDAWLSSHKIPSAVAYEFPGVVNVASALAGKYDLGIGVAKGGLYLTFIFESFGLETKIVQCHRRGRGAIFSWEEEPKNAELEGKKLIVLENDVITGRTTRRVIRELRKYNPAQVDLALVHNPTSTEPKKGKPLFGTFLPAVPSGYDQVYFPKDFNYDSFEEAVNTLEQRLRG